MSCIKNRKKIVMFVAMTLCLFLTVFLGSVKETDAASKYVIKVNRKKNVVTVYKNDVPVRVMLCSTGRNNRTPTGTYRTSQKIRWHVLKGPVYGQYCTRISGPYLFHSVYYYRMRDYNSLSVLQYRKLGTQASDGCVRLSVEDAKWIYDNCPLGTKVIIYSSSNSGPLGKPLNVKIPSSSNSQWDPTDPNKNNPYYKNRPKITISKSKKTTISLGSSYDLMEGVTAKTKKGKDITSRINVNGKVDTTKPEKYYLKYWVQDSAGNYTYKNFTVKVKKPSKPVFVGLESEKTITISNVYRTISHKSGVKAYDRNGTSLTKKIKVSVPKSYTKNGAVELISNGNKLRFHKPGTYTITFKVTGTKANGKKTTTKNMKITVLDNTAPVITNETAAQTIKEGDTYGTKQILSGISATTTFTNLTSKVTYTVKRDGQTVKTVDTSVPGTYEIIYSVTSPTGKTAAQVKRTVVVKAAPVAEPEVPDTSEKPEGTTTVPDSTTTSPDTTTETVPETTVTPEGPESSEETV